MYVCLALSLHPGLQIHAETDAMLDLSNEVDIATPESDK